MSLKSIVTVPVGRPIPTPSRCPAPTPAPTPSGHCAGCPLTWQDRAWLFRWGNDRAAGLPRPTAGQLDLQRPAQEGPDQHDDGEYCHAGEGGLGGDSADDVAGYQQLQAEQDCPAELLAETAVIAGITMTQPKG